MCFSVLMRFPKLFTKRKQGGWCEKRGKLRCLGMEKKGGMLPTSWLQPLGPGLCEVEADVM